MEGVVIKFPFVTRRRFDNERDLRLDLERKVNQLERAAEAYRSERDDLKAKLNDPYVATFYGVISDAGVAKMAASMREVFEAEGKTIIPMDRARFRQRIGNNAVDPATESFGGPEAWQMQRMFGKEEEPGLASDPLSEDEVAELRRWKDWKPPIGEAECAKKMWEISGRRNDVETDVEDGDVRDAISGELERSNFSGWEMQPTEPVEHKPYVHQWSPWDDAIAFAEDVRNRYGTEASEQHPDDAEADMRFTHGELRNLAQIIFNTDVL